MLYQEIETNHTAADATPWMPFTPLSDEVEMKLYRIDPVRETAGSGHTPAGVGDEAAEVFFVLVGELLFIDDNGTLLWRENCKTAIDRYRGFCRDHQIEERDLTSFAA